MTKFHSFKVFNPETKIRCKICERNQKLWNKENPNLEYRPTGMFFDGEKCDHIQVTTCNEENKKNIRIVKTNFKIDKTIQNDQNVDYDVVFYNNCFEEIKTTFFKN
jgi:hypothetical protein